MAEKWREDNREKERERERGKGVRERQKGQFTRRMSAN